MKHHHRSNGKFAADPAKAAALDEARVREIVNADLRAFFTKPSFTETLARLVRREVLLQAARPWWVRWFGKRG